MNTTPLFHGSDIEKICAYYHLDKNTVVNFGANVNPLGLSESVKKSLSSHLEVLSSYPDRDYTSLRGTIAKYCGVSADCILPGNGSSELIALLIEACAPKRALVLGPTYSEYSRELSFSGSTQDNYHLREEQDFVLDIDNICRTLGHGKYDFLILCNPNNPTSTAILRNDMERLLSFCSSKDIFVMIDETYVEFAPDIEAVTAVSFTKIFDNLCVLRGVSKFFAAPGLRLGYAVTRNFALLEKMKKKQIPWSLNSIGVFAGELLFRDKEYISRARKLILSERVRMYEALKKMPAFKTYEPYANFILVKILKKGVTASDTFELCIKDGLMIRDCSSFQCLDGEFIRFCIMLPEDNSKLLETLKKLEILQK